MPTATSSSRRILEERYASVQALRADDEEDYFSMEFRALGTECEVFYEARDQPHADEVKHAVIAWLIDFEATYSRFLHDSLLAKINASAGQHWFDIDPQTELLLDLCAHYHFNTQGAFDATSLPLSELWFWKNEHPTLPSAEAILAAKSLVDWKLVQRAPGRVFLPKAGMRLDFGGVGKEFAVDCLLSLCRSLGLTNVMVDLGGDIAVHGEPPEGGGWYIGLEDPTNTEQSYCGIRLRSGAAVATSGDYRRCFIHQGTRYGHILDSRKGWPVANGTIAASVIAPRCTTAGVLSTTCIILGGQDAIRMLDSTPGIEGCLWQAKANIPTQTTGTADPTTPAEPFTWQKTQLMETRGFRRNVLPQGWDD
jgi:thiamine biosynthesis lipoprotein